MFDLHIKIIQFGADIRIGRTSTMNSFILTICLVSTLSTSLSSTVYQYNDSNRSTNHYTVDGKPVVFNIKGNGLESHEFKEDSLSLNNMTDTIDKQVSRLSHTNDSTVSKTYFRDGWNLTDMISNSLTFGNSPIGTNSLIKLIVCLLSFLGLLISILLCYCKLFIKYCCKPEYLVDSV